MRLMRALRSPEKLLFAVMGGCLILSFVFYVLPTFAYPLWLSTFVFGPPALIGLAVSDGWPKGKRFLPALCSKLWQLKEVLGVNVFIWVFYSVVDYVTSLTRV